MTKLKSKLSDYEGGYISCGIPCEVCGVKNKKSYRRTFIETSWFRGDDEVNGNICENCYVILRKNNKKKSSK